MKTIKKLIAVILMLFLLVPYICAAEEPDSMQSAQTSQYLPLLSALGIVTRFEDGSYHLEDALTRAQFSAIAVRINPAYKNITATQGQIFKDIPSEFWAADEIAVLYGAKLISGMPDGNFYPDATISYTQMIKILVSMLGYGGLAEKKGGYPSGYLTVASGLDITSANTDEAVTRLTALELIYKTLMTKPILQTVYGGDEEYAESDKDFLALAHRVFKFQGRVDANRVSGIGGYEKTRNGTIRINGGLYLPPEDFDAYFMLGHHVTGYAYLNENEDEKEILLIEEDARCEIISVSAENVEQVQNFGPSTTAHTPYISYFGENDKSRKKIIPATASIIVNGCFVGYAGDVSDIFTGKENLQILCDDRGEAETVCVSRYEYYRVLSVDHANLRVADRYGKEEIDLNRGGSFGYEIYSDGASIELAEISAGDFLAVGYSGASVGVSEFIAIFQLGRTVKGSVSERRNNEVVIDGKTYKVSSKLLGDGKFLPGTKSVFYLGMNDEIISVDNGDNEELQYAYLMATDIGAGLNAALKLKMLTQSGGVYSEFKYNSDFLMALLSEKSGI